MQCACSVCWGGRGQVVTRGSGGRRFLTGSWNKSGWQVEKTTLPVMAPAACTATDARAGAVLSSSIRSASKAHAAAGAGRAIVPHGAGSEAEVGA